MNECCYGYKAAAGVHRMCGQVVYLYYMQLQVTHYVENWQIEELSSFADGFFVQTLFYILLMSLVYW